MKTRILFAIAQEHIKHLEVPLRRVVAGVSKARHLLVQEGNLSYLKKIAECLFGAIDRLKRNYASQVVL